MRRMYSENQLIELIQKYGGDIEKIKEELIGSFVRVLDAPSHTTLTNKEVEIFKEGVFINGTFLDIHNPVFLPINVAQYGGYLGLLLSDNGIYSYQISNSNVVSKNNNVFITLNSQTGAVSIKSSQTTIFNLNTTGSLKLNNLSYPSYPSNTEVGQLIYRKGVLQYYVPVTQDNITSGDVIATTSNLGKALIDHLDVEINGYRARYEYTNGNYVVYSSKSEVDSGAKLQINMISYNTTNGELSFNQMTFTPDN